MIFFWDLLDSFGDVRAVCSPSGLKLTYSQLAQRADDLLSGIESQTLVVIECDNHPDCLAAYLGCLRRGVVPLLVDSSLNPPLRDSLYNKFCPKFIYQRLVGEDGFEWKPFAEKSPKMHPDLALLMSTSGSTGSPQLVRLSHQNLQANAESIAQYLNITSRDRPITSLPIHYSYGLSVINSHLLVSACLLLTSCSVTERGFWDFFKSEKATSFAGVPTMYEMLRQLRFERMNLPSLRVLTQAGGRLSPESVRWFGELAHSRNISFFVMYGQTEATARISYLPSDHILDKTESIGKVIPGGTLSLRDETGSDVYRHDEVGELVYCGKNVMMGYAESIDELVVDDVLNGKLFTGDLARRDAEGFYYIVGRQKRFIKIHGNRFGLDEVERQIQAAGVMAYVTGRDDLLMVALTDRSVDAPSFAKKMASDYHLHHSVIRVAYCENIPVSTAGKVQYQELLSQLEINNYEDRAC